MTHNHTLIAFLAIMQDGVDQMEAMLPLHLEQHPELDSDTVELLNNMSSTIKVSHQLNLKLAEENMTVMDRMDDLANKIINKK